MKMQFKYQHKSIIKPLIIVMMSLGLSYTALADTTVSQQIKEKEIQGYAPYMKSVGAELLTEVKESTTNKITNFPWTLNDDNTQRGPTIGSIAYIPDIFCSVLNKDIAAAKADASIGKLFDNFNFVDKDLDPCHNLVGAGISVKWYMLDNVTPWTEKLKWEDLNPVAIAPEYIIKAGSDVAKKYQNKHTFAPLISQPTSLNVLDAVEIPTAALGKRIGFVLEPKSKYGVPSIGKPVKVWDLNKYFSQNAPGNAGELLEDNPGFVFGPNLTESLDGGLPSTAGGVVQLGRPPYVRSIGAHYATDGPNIGHIPDGTQRRTFEVVYTGASASNGGLPEVRPRRGAIVYIPDAFCQYKNSEIETEEQINALAGGLGFPALNLATGKNKPDVNKAKLKYFRPYFWINDADEDSCDIESNQIEWFVVEPKGAEFAAFKQKIENQISANVDLSNIYNQYDIELDTIWNKVKSWDDVQIVNNIKISKIEPGQGGKYNFDAIGGNFLSAMKFEDEEINADRIRLLVRPAFIYTPKTKSGLPDTGRQIKVPYVASKLWGQRPSTRPTTLADAAPNSSFITNNPSGSGEFITPYPQLINANASSVDTFGSLTQIIRDEYVDFNCLLDPKKIPLQDCTRPNNLPSQNTTSTLIQQLRSELPQRRGAITPKATNEFSTIENFYLSGKLGLGEIITVNYTYIPISSNDPSKLGNSTRYEVGEVGTTKGNITLSSPYAGEELNIGKNSFKLPALTRDQIGKNLEITLWALNDYDEGGNKETVSFNTLPKVTDPAVDNVKIESVDSVVMAGSVLTGRYDFIPSDASVLTGDKSLFSWIGATPVTGKVITQSGQVDNYTVSASDMGQVVTLSVTAKDEADRSGNTKTDSVYPLAPAPSVKNVVITSSNETRLPGYKATLTASYEFDSGIANNTIDNSTYAFYINNDVVANQSKTYNFTANDLGKTISFKIVPKNSYNVEGAPGEATYLLNRQPPSVENVKISAATTSYSPFFFGLLTASYDYLPGISANAAEDLSTLAQTANLNWYGGSTTNNTKNYVFGPNEIGKILTFSVTPQDLAGQKGVNGLATYQVASAPAIQNLNIAVNVFNSTTPYQVLVSGNYTYIPSTTDKPLDNSTYAWTGIVTPVNGSINNGQNSGSVPPIGLSADDAGKLITLEMTPRDGNLWEGTKVTATTRAPSQLLPPKITNLKLENSITTRGSTYYVGDTVLAKYTFTPSSVSSVDASSYTWTAASGTQPGTVTGPLSYTIKPADAGSVIRLDMEAIDGLGNIGNKATASTSSVISPPSVKDVKITATMEQTAPWNVSVVGSYTFIAGKSPNPTNNSTYSWTGITTPVLDQTTTGAPGNITLPALTIDKVDAGKVLTLTVKPMDLAGYVGQAQSATYTIPTPAIVRPQIKNLLITHVSKPGSVRYLPNDVLGASYDFIAGSESNVDRSLFTWSAKSGTSQGVIGTNQLRYTIKSGDVGSLIRLTMTAKDGAGYDGNTTFDEIDEIVSTLPSLNNVVIQFTSPEALTIEGTYNFIAGTSVNSTDKSRYRWRVGSDPLVAFNEVATAGQVKGTQGYTVKQADVGKFITLEILPRDASGLEGTALISNSVTYQALNVDTLSIVGQPIETQSLTASATFTFGNNKTNSSEAVWYKAGVEDKRLALNAPYPLVTADIGKVIGLRVTAKDGNGILGNTKIANDTEAVTPSYFPPFIDGVGIFYFDSRTLVLPGHFLGGSYETFKDGSIKGDKSTYSWISGTTVRSSGDVGEGRNIPAYGITENDIGNVITLSVTARDGAKNPGNTDEDQTIRVIQPPKVSNLVITQNGNPVNKLIVNTTLSGRYDFVTERIGASDASIVTWFVDSTSVQTSKITTSGVSPNFTLLNDYVGKIIKMQVSANDTLGTPGGNTAIVSTVNKVETVSPSIENLTISAFFETSPLITGTYTYKASSSDNPSDASTYEWLANDVVIQSGYLLGTNKVDGVNGYTVLTKDAGKTIRLKIVPTDKAGIKGTPVYSSNSIVYTAPQVSGVSITGKATLNTNLKAVHTFTKGSNSTNTSTANWYVSGVLNSSKAVTANFLITNSMIGKTITLSVTAKDGNQIVGNTANSSNSIGPITEPTPVYSQDYWLMDSQGPGQFISITSGQAFANLGWPASSKATKVTYEWMVGTKLISTNTLVRNNTTEYAVGGNQNLSAYRGQTVCIYLTGITANGTKGAREQAWCRVIP